MYIQTTRNLTNALHCRVSTQNRNQPTYSTQTSIFSNIQAQGEDMDQIDSANQSLSQSHAQFNNAHDSIMTANQNRNRSSLPNKLALIQDESSILEGPHKRLSIVNKRTPKVYGTGLLD